MVGCVIAALLASPSAAAESTRADRSARISTEQFLSSPLTKFFQAGDYAKALKAAEELAKTYPDDPLLLRYRAIVLTRLGRIREALAIFRTLVARAPQHVPTRLFLGEAYLRHGDRATAAEQWQWVIRHSDSDEYRRWAQAQLTRLRAGAAKRAPPEQRLYVSGATSLTYDSNPLLKADDKALAESGNEKAGYRTVLDLDVGYPVWLKPNTRVDVIYLNREDLHDGETDAVDFATQGVAVEARHRTRLGDHSYLFGGRYSTRVNFLRSDLFSVVNRMLVSAETAFTPHTITYAYSRASLSNFGPDGPNPPQTSRDGFRGALGLTQFWYTKDFRRHLFLSQEVNLHETRGANFTRRGTASRIGVHTVVDGLPKTEWDLSTGFGWGRYPRFVSLSSSDTARRRDARFDVYTALTYRWTPHLASRLEYQFINNDNRNDFFDRSRHIAGIELLFSY